MLQIPFKTRLSFTKQLQECQESWWNNANAAEGHSHPSDIIIIIFQSHVHVPWIWLEGNKVIFTDMHRPNDDLIGKKLNYLE